VNVLALLPQPLSTAVWDGVEAGWFVLAGERCRNGHEQTEHTVYVSPAGRAYCRPCRTEWTRRWRRA
jgi:hypothetical protein